jgi:hypothetical protein
MSTNSSTDTNDKKKQAKSLDPGNLMLLVYTVAIALIIICGGILQAKADQSSAKVLSAQVESARLLQQ